MKYFQPVSLLLLLLATLGCRMEENNTKGQFYAVSVRSGDKFLYLTDPTLNKDIDPAQPLRIEFNLPPDPATLSEAVRLLKDQTETPVTFSMEQEKVAVIVPASPMEYAASYTISISDALKSTDGRDGTPFTAGFFTKTGLLQVDSVISGGVALTANPPAQNIDRNFSARIYFNQPLDPATVNTTNVKLYRTNDFAGIQVGLEQNNRVMTVSADQPLRDFEAYTIYVSPAVQGIGGYRLQQFSRVFYTAVDPTPKFPVISDDALLDLVQEKTFRYFWDFGHPVSGMARERNSSGDVVTSGGTGFGIMAMIVGIERGFITRNEGVQRWKKVVGFLKNTAQRYHGAWPHWLNGSSGVTIPFSTKDNGADLVETSYLVQGLLTVRQYLNPADPEEAALQQDIQQLWEEVEWDWFTRGGQQVLYWHWSPNYNWDMNFQIRGYNECLITYFLAACSPTHAIPASVYHQGWARNGQIRNNNTYFGYNLPLGYAYGGPLFFAHYSFLGLDPRNLKDTYADYWTQNRNHTLINRAYCVANPLKKVGYSEQCWGLTASDNQQGYNAHAPDNDLGVITPTAALSSFPYTPAESMEALKFFYYQIGDRLWGQYGFYDAFNPTVGWYADSFLAIDQGPIVVMIENHRTGKLWQLFMSAPEVAVGAGKLGFTY